MAGKQYDLLMVKMAAFHFPYIYQGRDQPSRLLGPIFIIINIGNSFLGGVCFGFFVVVFFFC